MSKRDVNLLLEDMLEAADKILAYTEGMSYNSFMSDSKTVDAVVRNFEIIGEAASRIPIEFRSDHPQVAWRRIIGFRNRIVHEYFGIDYEILWQIVQENLVELTTEIKELLGSE